jgi:hypothetical protein
MRFRAQSYKLQHRFDLGLQPGVYGALHAKAFSYPDHAPVILFTNFKTGIVITSTAEILTHSTPASIVNSIVEKSGSVSPVPSIDGINQLTGWNRDTYNLPDIKLVVGKNNVSPGSTTREYSDGTMLVPADIDVDVNTALFEPAGNVKKSVPDDDLR